jgi:hypothetical protein
LIVGEGDYWCQGVTTDTDLRLAWSRFIGGGTKIDIVPGDHLDMLFEPLVRDFGEKLGNRLREAQVANWKGVSETAGRGSSRAAQVTAVPPATSWRKFRHAPSGHYGRRIVPSHSRADW